LTNQQRKDSFREKAAIRDMVRKGHGATLVGLQQGRILKR
jgi:hypothetical protein